MLLSDLEQFTGTTQYYFLPYLPTYKYTDGVRYVAQNGQAFWLLDEIFFSQKEEALQGQHFQAWKLEVQEDKSALLSCEDGNYRSLFSKKIPHTDFPLEKIEFFFIDGFLILPSEY